MTGAKARLDAIYADPEDALRCHKAAGGLVVGYLGATVPVELIAAAGALPVRLKGGPQAETPLADRYMEPVREAYLRRIFDRLLAGAYQDLDALVIARASEGLLQFHHLLDHVRSVDLGLPLPRIVFLDILRTPTELSARYNRDRLAEFCDTLGEVGSVLTDAAVRDCIDASNHARAMFRTICTNPGLDGSTRLKLATAGQVLPVSEFVDLMQQLGEGDRQPGGPRIALTGSPQERPGLYDLLEARGASVIGEDHDWGERLYEADVPSAGDALRDLAEHYQHHAPGPRQMAPRPPEQTLGGTTPDAVIAYYEENDDTLGWDYPMHRDRLAASGIPSLVLRGGSDGALAPGEDTRLDAFLSTLAQNPAVAR
ncbi:hypothetical protein HKCCE2091_03550 [Rhodobacterales bacterium HKCCE2091]|nr:hypothetical protein [Rhodobacterales bacterium HKCCE2091]